MPQEPRPIFLGLDRLRCACETLSEIQANPGGQRYGGNPESVRSSCGSCIPVPDGSSPLESCVPPLTRIVSASADFGTSGWRQSVYLHRVELNSRVVVFPHKNRAVPIPETTMNEIGWRCIKLFTPCGARMPNIPNRISETNSPSNKEVRNAPNHQGKVRPRNLSVPGFITIYKSTMPQNMRNNDSILYHI
jgi:hypothetical protein